MTTASLKPKEPQDFSRRILLMVTGRTPQVVTETLYAIAVRPLPPARPFVPTEIHLVTTAEGYQDARLALLDPASGWFHRLCADYGLAGITFGPDQIHRITDAQGRPVDDIRTAAEHDACADLITERVRVFTADPQAALHVSLAGGRKTMTYYLGNALTLFGRAQDRLSHVLVPPPFESNREFFYPTPQSRALYIEPLKRYFDAKDAEVTLADIPFVRLRDSLPSRFKTLEQGQARFTAVVEAMQQALAPGAVRIDPDHHCLRLADGRVVELAGADLAFYLWMARRRLAGDPVVRIPGKDHGRWTTSERALYTGYLEQYQAEAARLDIREVTAVGARAVGAMTNAFFHQRMTSIREQLEESLGPLAEVYAIQAVSPGRPAGYGLALAPEHIRILAEDCR
ncbi:CRISPR-associated ring nuclease Csm6 [uncultured Thiodictyon sp.]|uniref:CRISPR-associated ring nuclease Csm6 n=1 Tax=uncultured Thiodictyon sp. TaxID=1846217 RepID=UPI0025D8A040|nr:CRISPR-associated ring nuclease Csm6 [uncultured Thiodictyon sp.]